MEDILGIILSNIDRGSTFKSARLVCRAWRNISDKLFPDGHTRFANHLQTIIEKILELIEDSKDDIVKYLYNKHIFFDNFHRLNSNSNITWDFIKKHPELPWNLVELMEEINITDELVDMYVEAHIDDDEILYKSNMQLSWDSIVKLGPSRIPFRCPAPAITPEILEHIETNWDRLTSSWYHRKMTEDNDMCDRLDDNILAAYGTEEVIVSRQLFNNPVVHSNQYISCDFVLKYCCKNAVETAIQNNFIQLHQRGIMTFDRAAENPTLYLSVDTSSVESPYPIDPGRPVVFSFILPWALLSCEVHKYVRSQGVQGYICINCSSTEELKISFNDQLLALNTRDIIRNNKYTTDDVESYRHVFHEDFVDYGSFETIKKYFSEYDYSRNLNVPLQYVIHHCPNIEFICYRSDLTWEFVMDHIDEKWLKLGDIWYNNFDDAN